MDYDFLHYAIAQHKAETYHKIKLEEIESKRQVTLPELLLDEDNYNYVKKSLKTKN